ncbi:MAG: hypothetical protein IJX81_05720 [Clostridia bacterium]|nr:hypothetical protein [Clostridia bacterium]
MQREKIKATICKILFYFTVTILTCVLFVLLGSFYIAVEHSIGLNIIVWSATIFLAHSLVYLIRFLFNLIRKHKIKHPFIDWISLSVGAGVVAIICLALSTSVEDYLYVSVMGGFSGVLAIIQAFLSLRKK